MELLSVMAVLDDAQSKGRVSHAAQNMCMLQLAQLEAWLATLRTDAPSALSPHAKQYKEDAIRERRLAPCTSPS